MRRKLQNAYDKSELILNTGYSYQFVSDYEKAKYVEYYLPEEDNNVPLHNRRNVSITMTRSEFEEILALYKKEGKPFTQGKIEGKELNLYGATEYKLLKDVLKYRKRRENKEIIPANLDLEFPEWNQLTEKQKQLVVSLIRELVSKTENS